MRSEGSGEDRGATNHDRGLTFHPTVFRRVPIGGIVIRISSPAFNVNESGGTTPVPVRRKHPFGKLLLRKRYSTSSSGFRFISFNLVAPENATAPPRRISS